MYEVVDNVGGPSSRHNGGSSGKPKVGIFTDSKSCIERLRSMKPTNEREIQMF
jgi:hypothetical protein